MAQKLTLTTPVTFPSVVEWEVVSIALDREAPSLKAMVQSNTGERRAIRYAPDENDSQVEAAIRAGLKFINDGNFRPQGKTLQQWLLEKFAQDGHLGPGSVTGTPD